MAVALPLRLYGLDAICAAAAAQADSSDQAVQFTRRLFERVADRDLASAPVEQRAGAALCLLAFARRRLPGVAKVRVFNPVSADHGFESRFTVVQIVNDDMPFLVNSVVAEFTRRDIGVHMIAHPVMGARRDLDGDLVAVGVDAGDRARSESLMYIEIDRQADALLLDDLSGAIGRVLAEVRLAVEDWRAMRAACLDAIDDLSPDPAADRSDHEEFLRWLEADHFTFLGYRRYRYADDPAQPGGLRYDLIADSSLGILRRDSARLFQPGLGNGEAMAALARGPQKLMVVKTDKRSLVHRDGVMDCVIVKTYDADGRATGERRFTGLFTSTTYHALVQDIPLLRSKLAAVRRRLDLDARGHDGKALQDIFDSYPRDELFQIDEDTLYEHALGILQLQERRRVALFVRRDVVGRFANCLVYAPRERFTAELSARFAAILEHAWNGKVTSIYGSGNTASPLAQALYTVTLDARAAPMPDLATVEHDLAEAATSWSDRLRLVLQANSGEVAGRAEARRWRDAFPPAYRDTFDAAMAMGDIGPLQSGLDGMRFGLWLQRDPDQPLHRFNLRLFHPKEAIALSDILPLLENLGLRVLSEAPFLLGGIDGVALQVLTVETADKSDVDLETHGERFSEALKVIRSGAAENDGLNRLVLKASLAWREVVVLRTYAKYLRQIGMSFSQEHMERVIGAYPAIARGAVDLFTARFDPALGEAASPARTARLEEVEAGLARELEGVAALDEDRILRRFLNAIRCSLRTNFWQRDADGNAKEWISVKIDSRTIDDLPAPRPLVEIFVYSPRMEGIHLRGGRVARGGIRWSDRREDFRTEILGLMKTQMVKNAVIVPVGSKGGFYVKRPPLGQSREEIQAEGIYCYRTLMRGLLDITDNYLIDSVAPPPDVIRHDGDDPYLVVAADKGTATFSDIANAIARDYGFWLDDAFASGGSAGYDHKKMGITARGAWESVKRHFRELDLDIQTTPFTAVGVGDMSGDVFGNGMLLSLCTRLIAAFDHRHIFIDPSPDPARALAERQRLFDLPRSSWMDYEKELISEGGGVFDRSAKSITLSAEARRALRLEAERLTPIELMRAILKAEVDLLYFGGIGTYIKASSESHADVGDRATEALRINGNEVRARVIGEGANLGMTQLGRVEAALNGRRLNTDALDNSAGVDTSDHEVNIKIVTGEAIRRGALAEADRDPLLFSMTEDVGALVLRHNYQQSMAVSVAEAQAAEDHDRLERLMRGLERQGRLDRAVEFLPDTAGMRARALAKQYLTRPELSVLLAYAKIDLQDEILDSDLPDDPLLEAELLRYFPPALQAGYRPAILGHRLRREIATLQVVNSLVNRCGPTFVRDIGRRTGAPAAETARAFTVVRDSARLRELWTEIESLDSQLKARAQTAMLVASQRFLRHAVQWTVRRMPQPLDTMAATEQLRGAIDTLGDLPATLIGETESASLLDRAHAFETLGAPAEIARRAASLDLLAVAGDLMQAAQAAGCDIETAAKTYFRLGDRLGLALLRTGAHGLPRDGQWPGQAALAMGDELDTLQANLLGSVLRAAADVAANDPDAALAKWGEGRKLALERADRLREELAAAGSLDLAMLAVATAELRTLV